MEWFSIDSGYNRLDASVDLQIWKLIHASPVK